ncbi:MAG: exodeoxyribonuclease VII small subunit [Eggerthellales bacterium]|nr:exodeoxyribonuclease VII small subunit [Eggerthellales bacterium]
MADINEEIQNMTFRQAMAELDQIVAQLESNTLELEESLQKYERGVALIVSLKGRLNEAQQRVDVLMGELSGETDDKVQDTTLS